MTKVENNITNFVRNVVIKFYTKWDFLPQPQPQQGKSHRYPILLPTQSHPSHTYQCKAARKQTKNSLSLAIDLSEIDAAAISLLASRMSNRVQSSESAALFFPVRLFTYRRLTCSLLPAAHKHHALSLLSCFKSDSDYVLCSHNTTQNSNTLEHHYFYLTFFFFALFRLLLIHQHLAKNTKQTFWAIFCGVWFFSLLKFAHNSLLGCAAETAQKSCFTAVGLIALDAAEFGC